MMDSQDAEDVQMQEETDANTAVRMDEDDVVPDWLNDRRDRDDMRVAPRFSRGWEERDDRRLLADVAFNRHSMNDGHHVSPSDNGMIQVGTDGIRVELAQGIDEEAFKKTLSAATRATIGLDLSQTLPGNWEHCEEFARWIKERQARDYDYQAYMADRQTWDCGHDEHRFDQALDKEPVYEGHVPIEDWEEMLKGGLQTALETQTIIFAVSGVSRTCTHQLVRSRRAAFHQQSQRASYMGDTPEFRMPESIWRHPQVRGDWYKAVIAAWRAYRSACEHDVSYQDARFILSEGTTNFIMLEYPVREFLNVYAYRACSMFQWEIVEVMRKCKEVLVAAHPWIEPYVKISCEKTGPVDLKFSHGDPTTLRVEHHCTFQGWENVEGQCDFPWAREEARTFKPAFHKIERKK